MIGSELGKRDPASTAVRTDLVVVPSPLCNHRANPGQRCELLLILAQESVFEHAPDRLAFALQG